MHLYVVYVSKYNSFLQSYPRITDMPPKMPATFMFCQRPLRRSSEGRPSAPIS